ncbi:STAS domain-containing protein [Dactylosporangium sp. NPDC051484]|uniref:STAS domain-containing protein n=1 Tax=Dactylosporangium sp. NPDC051484 TaxID=3154942 RepID=UPI00344B4CD3
MTALLSHDGTDFSLVCDGCGRTVGNLAASLPDWALAWGLFSQDGWRGSDLAIGPHTCGRCVPAASLAHLGARSLDRPSVTPSGRSSQRMVIQVLSDVRAIYLRGDLLPADEAQLWDLLSGEPERTPHLMVDVSPVQRRSSAAVDVLVRSARRAAGSGGRTCLVGACPGVSSALRMLCLHDVLPIHADQVSALEYLRGGRSDAVSRR